MDAAGRVRRPRASFGEGGRRQPRGRAIDPRAPSGSIRVASIRARARVGSREVGSRISRKRRVVEPGVPGVVVQERRRLGGDARARRVRRGELRRARDCRTDADAAEVHETRPKQDIQLARLVRRVRRAQQSHGARDVRRGQTGRGEFRARRRGRRRTRFSALFGVFLLPARAAFDVLALSLAAAAASDGYRDASLACRALRKRYSHASSSSSSASETAASPRGESSKIVSVSSSARASGATLSHPHHARSEVCARSHSSSGDAASAAAESTISIASARAASPTSAPSASKASPPSASASARRRRGRRAGDHQPDGTGSAPSLRLELGGDARAHRRVQARDVADTNSGFCRETRLDGFRVFVFRNVVFRNEQRRVRAPGDRDARAARQRHPALVCDEQEVTQRRARGFENGGGSRVRVRERETGRG